MARKRKPALPQRSHSEVLEAFPHLRQSLLASDDNCALLTRFELEGYQFDNHAQARGKLFHAFAAELLRTLRRTGEVKMEVSEALEILYEICAQRDVPDEEVVTVPMRERRLLRILAIKFANENEFRMDRLIEVEKRLYATVLYENEELGKVERVITGQPDALIAEPPDGAIIPDWKTTLQPPPEYKGQSEDTPSGVSYTGYFQQKVYALLVFANYPSVQRCTLREFYPLANEARVATVHRVDLEHIERDLAVQIELLDRKLRAGGESKLWAPSPGKHCNYCPRPASCPIERRARDEGAITGSMTARKFAGELVVAERVKKHHTKALKAYVEENGPVPVKDGKGRSVIGWKQSEGGGRRFGVHASEHFPPEKLEDDPALKEAFDEAAARRAA